MLPQSGLTNMASGVLGTRPLLVHALQKLELNELCPFVFFTVGLSTDQLLRSIRSSI